MVSKRDGVRGDQPHTRAVASYGRVSPLSKPSLELETFTLKPVKGPIATVRRVHDSSFAVPGGRGEGTVPVAPCRQCRCLGSPLRHGSGSAQNAVDSALAVGAGRRASFGLRRGVTQNERGTRDERSTHTRALEKQRTIHRSASPGPAFTGISTSQKSWRQTTRAHGNAGTTGSQRRLDRRRAAIARAAG